MKRLLLLTLCFLNLTAVFANQTITGKIVDSKTDSIVEMVAVQLFSYSDKDSTMVAGAQSDMNGKFTLDNIQQGNYKLIISSLGYQTKSLSVRVKDKDINLGKVAIEEDAILLSEVEVHGKAVELTVKGDTLDYNASAFKTTENAMVEDLLKKMPGVEISSDGSVTVNGEQIKAIRVDGKKFFGDDVQSATKNIPANMIDRVQVIDQQSEMAKLTGFEDDDTERIINLTLKQEKKRGLFGNINGGLGADLIAENNKWLGYHQDSRTPAEDTRAFFSDEFRYNTGVFLNILSGETQTTIIGSANNTNEMRTGKGFGGGNSSNSGITRSENIGANVSAEINDDLELGGNAAFAHSDNITLTISKQETYANEATYNNTDSTMGETKNYNSNLRFEIEHKIDSTNKLIFQPTVSYTNQTTINSDIYNYSTTQNDTTITTSSGNQANIEQSSQIQGSLRVTYSHSFDKKGRKLTMRANASLNNTTGNEHDKYNKQTIDTTEIVDQKIRTTNNNYSYSLRTSFVEPLFNNTNFLEIALNLSGSYRQSDKTQHALNSQSGLYDILDSAYSSNFTNQFFSEALELNYQYKQEKYNITAGIKVNPSQTLVEQKYLSGNNFDTLLNVWNFAPSFSFKYKFGKKQFARIQYRGTTSQPSVSQMQPSINNSNSMSVRVGNLNLNPAFQHTLRLMFSKYNQDKMSSITAGIRANLTKDALVNNAVYDKTGKTYRQTVNATALPWSIGGDLMYSTPFANNWLTFNSRTSVNYNTQIAYIAQGLEQIDIYHLPLGTLSQTNNFKAQEDLSFRLTHDIADAGLKLTGAYSRTNSTTNNSITNVGNWSATADLTFHLPKSWNIATDFGYTGRYGYNLSDINEMIWNISIDKSVLNGAGIIQLKVYDLLNQKKNIIETVGENYVKYAKYNTLPTYFIISFTYKINKMGDLQAKGRAKNMIDEIENKGEMPMTPPNGPMPPSDAPMGPPPGM